jgi:hypothetical protein
MNDSSEANEAAQKDLESAQKEYDEASRKEE